jgi:hypothetical protein
LRCGKKRARRHLRRPTGSNSRGSIGTSEAPGPPVCNSSPQKYRVFVKERAPSPRIHGRAHSGTRGVMSLDGNCGDGDVFTSTPYQHMNRVIATGSATSTSMVHWSSAPWFNRPKGKQVPMLPHESSASATSRETADAVLALSVLAPAEQKELAECEAIIARGWQSFVETGRALARIRDRKLYRAQYDTFEGYCRAKWLYGRSHTYRLIAAAELLRNLSPIGDIPVPSHEAQVRPLIGVPPEQAQAAWRKALAKANGKTVTAKLVRQAVIEVMGKPAAKPATRNRRKGFPAKHWEAALVKALHLIEQIETAVTEGGDARVALGLLAGLKRSLQDLKGDHSN